MNQTDIELNFDAQENKIFYKSLITIDSPVYISIKDRDSNVCIYGYRQESLLRGIEYWAIPIPKSKYDFEGDNFSGFLFEIYKDKRDPVPIYFDEIELGRYQKKKTIPNNPFINFEPLFVNYSQFFVNGIYNNFLAGERVFSVLDIGANVGLFTEWCLDRFGNDTKILAFEPNKDAIEAFKVLHKGKENVELIEAAVSSSNDPMILKIDPNNSLISSKEVRGGNFSESYEVPSVKLMDVLKERNIFKINLLKMDVEGAEYEIFESLSDSDIQNYFDAFLIEFHYNTEDKASDLLTRLENLGFYTEVAEDDTRYDGSIFAERGTIFARKPKIR